MRSSPAILSLLVIGFCFSFYACDRSTETKLDSSFGIIQNRILTASCAITGCHASVADISFAQHHLILENKVSYLNLINIIPANVNAQQNKLLLVKPFHAEESLLFHKLHRADHHAKDYGNPMPLGLELLSEGQVEFVRRWIEAGAPEKGNVADASLMNDTSSQAENFEPLVPPEAGKGIQLVLPDFTIAPNFEREFFVYKKLGNTEPIFVNRFEIKMRQNSHHFILYDFDPSIPEIFRPVPELVRDIRSPAGTLIVGNMLAMPYHVFMMGTQTPYLDYQFPEGVAMTFPAGAMADFNSHYVNKQAKEIIGEVFVNLHTVDPAKVLKVAKTLNLANQNLNLLANQRTTATKSFQFDKSISILSLTSHTHKLGEIFIIKISGGARNGEIVYTNTDWHHPTFTSYSPPIILNQGEGLVSEITYNNTTEKNVKFGLTSEDEMGIIFGYFYEQ